MRASKASWKSVSFAEVVSLRKENVNKLGLLSYFIFSLKQRCDKPGKCSSTLLENSNEIIQSPANSYMSLP